MIPFPDKKYSIIYADPPWSYSDSGCSGAAAAQYATMSINELKQLPVNPAGGGIAADDCVLFMWATYPKMQEALDLILNGPTINGIKKDEVRAMLRETYTALKQYEKIGPMASPFINDPTAIVARAFSELYPGVEYVAQYVPDLRDETNGTAYGLTIFPDDGSTPIVCISAEAPISAAPELLAHELAHVATPEDTEHGESWSAASEAIFKKYNELLDTMIPDEPEPILSPHQPGDGGILTMPLRDNVPEPPTDDWQLTTCPVCGAECWQTDTARRILALEPDVRTACTACALKGLGK